MKQKVSGVMNDVLNAAYVYLDSKYAGEDLNALKGILLSLAGIKSFEFSTDKDVHYSYDDIQDVLSNLNEKESIRKSKGVYYTPLDVVKFILENSIKAMYGKLGTNGLHVMDLNGIPYRSFCLSKQVFDPTCGAGEFLLAALEMKFDLLDNHTDSITESMIKKIVKSVHGNDINVESAAITKIRLFLCTLRRYGLKRVKGIGPLLNENFHHYDFISNAFKSRDRYDLIIGNPPYVEDSQCGLDLKEKYGNIYANVLINSKDILNAGGAIGFVIPLSYVATPRMQRIRDDLFENISEQYILSYADRPDCLFKSVHQKLCILIGSKRNGEKKVFTGNYQYWYKEEREKLFEQTVAVKNVFAADGYIPKLGTSEDISIYKKVCRTKGRIPLINLQKAGGESVYVNMRAAFWIKAFREKHSGSEYKRFTFDSSEKAYYFDCLINSSLFWWYWICISDCWHITNKELQGFMVPLAANLEKARILSVSLEEKLEETKLYVGTKQTEYEYKHRECVDEIHAIDDYVNSVFGLTDAENLYIKNFGYRYRISGGAE